MNPIHLRQRRRHALSLLLRRAPLLIVGSLAAAALVWIGLGVSPPVVTARQAMALQNVGWTDLSATHNRNVAWLASEQDDLIGEAEGLELFIELPDDLQLTAFSLVAAADTTDEATAAVSLAAERLVATQGGHVPVTVSIRETLMAESAELAAGIAAREDSVRTKRAELDKLIDEAAPLGVRENLADEIYVLEIEWVEMSGRVVNVENQLSDLDVTDQSALAIIERIGEPVIQQIESDVRLRWSLLAGFVAATLLGLISLRVDGRRSPLKSIGQVRFHFPNLDVIDLASRDAFAGSPKAGAQAALLMRLRGHKAAARSLVVPAGTPKSARYAVALITALSPNEGNSYTAVAEDHDSPVPPDVDHVLIAITPNESRGSDVVDSLKRVSDVPTDRITAIFIPSVSLNNAGVRGREPGQRRRLVTSISSSS